MFVRVKEVCVCVCEKRTCPRLSKLYFRLAQRYPASRHCVLLVMLLTWSPSQWKNFPLNSCAHRHVTYSNTATRGWLGRSLAEPDKIDAYCKLVCKCQLVDCTSRLQYSNTIWCGLPRSRGEKRKTLQHAELSLEEDPAVVCFWRICACGLMASSAHIEHCLHSLFEIFEGIFQKIDEITINMDFFLVFHVMKNN